MQWMTNRPGGLTHETQAIGVQPGEKGGVAVVSKKAGFANKPAQSHDNVNFSANKSTRK